MTTNQQNYWKLQEEKRHNAVEEEMKSREAAVKEREATVKEQAQDLDERMTTHEVYMDAQKIKQGYDRMIVDVVIAGIQSIASMAGSAMKMAA